MRVLVVEDERKIADALKLGLEAEGYQVVTVASGEEGFFCLNLEPFDLMLLDLMLPGRDGLEILQTMRAKEPQRSQRKTISYKNIQLHPFGYRANLYKILFLLRSVVAPLRETVFRVASCTIQCGITAP